MKLNPNFTMQKIARVGMYTIIEMNAITIPKTKNAVNA